MSSITRTVVILLTLAALAGGGPGPARADQAADLTQLLVQGHFWYARGRLDLARAAWRKVLLVEPRNAEALAALRELDTARPDAVDRDLLARARALALQGRYAEALALYKQAFQGGPPPTSFYNAEYLATLAGTDEGWQTAVDGLRELVRLYPSNPRYRLELGKAETYREETRRAGIARLAALADDPEYGQAARAAWRQALLWLAAKPADKALFEAWLARQPDDAAVRQRLATLERPAAPAGTAPTGGYALLAANRMAEAAARFLRTLRDHPDDADALAGLGILRLRQQRFQEAQRYLARAIAADPARRDDLQEALDDARFWALHKAAEQARQAGQLSRAVQYVTEALQQRPEQPETLLLRAQIASDLEAWDVARRYYLDVLRVQPDNAVAKEELAAVLFLHGDRAEAERLARQYHLPSAPYRAARARLEVARLRRAAEQAESPAQSIALLEQALAEYPDDPWLRLDLARAYRAAGRGEDADRLLTAMLERLPDDPLARFVHGLYLAETGRWGEALASLEQVPAAQRDAAFQQLYRHVWGNRQAERARQALAAGDRAEAERIARTLAERAGDDPELLLIRADLLADLGQRAAALAAARQAAAAITPDDMDLAIRHAAVLLKLGETDAAGERIAALQARSGQLTPRQRTAVERLALGLALQRAEALRRQGRAAEALDQLQPWLARHGDDPGLQLMRAALLDELGRRDEALALYEAVARRSPDNPHAWPGAVGAAMALRDYPRARRLVAEGLTAQPDNPRLLALRGELALLRGRRNAAAADLQRALQLQAERPAAGQPEAWVAQAEARLRALGPRRDRALTVGLDARRRDGRAGLDELRQVATPLRYEQRTDYEHSWGLELLPTRLDARPLDGDGPDAARFGSLVLDRAAGAGRRLDQREDGVGLTLFRRSRQWDLALGSTPLDFPRANLVGDLTWHRQGEDRHLRAGLVRHAVRESLLSYAGASDPASGRRWGGVTRGGLELAFDRSLGGWGLYGEAGLYDLRGDGVRANRELKLQGGLFRDLIDRPERRLQLGANLLLRRFDHNLRHFTLGHGGYFSPQRYAALTFPLTWDYRHAGLRLRLGAELGVQDYREDDSPVFPDDDALQAQLETLAAGDPALSATYPGKDTTEFVYRLHGRLEYRLGPRLSWGGWASAARSDDYEEYGAGLYLRWTAVPRADGFDTRLPAGDTPFRRPW